MDEKHITIEELKTAILEWWSEHEYDIFMIDEDEYNVYDDEPKFVTLAKKLNEQL